ncbi:hypothetical protein B0O99DRAFT_617544 [Bisporella sp. PMI_857]|nr:hypothetical protein B0O99DRAFT_617544 [Bisporella sp. PMI_857]
MITNPSEGYSQDSCQVIALFYSFSPCRINQSESCMCTRCYIRHQPHAQESKTIPRHRDIYKGPYDAKRQEDGT